MASAWPLIGRASELAQIDAAIRDPGCHGAVIAALPGVGKSRLAREACALAEARGALILWAQATASSATIPLGALAGLIPDEVRSDEPRELVRRCADAVRARAGARTVVLAVDDAQLLDDASAALILHLAMEANVFVLVTLRAGMPAPDAIAALWKDAGARLTELDPLSDEDIERMVEAGLGGPVERSAVQRLIDTVAGNPMFSREMVLGAVDAGILCEERGLWRLRRRPPVPQSLTALVTRRMVSLPEEARKPLELLALAEPLGLDEVARLSSYEGLAAAEERGLVVVSAPADGSKVRITHPMYGEVIRSEMPVLRGRLLRLRLAEAVQSREPLTPDDALRAARLITDAGELVPPTLLLDAAAAANLAGDPTLGAELAQRAVNAGVGLRASLLLARAHAIRSGFADAEAALADVEASAAGDPDALEYVTQRLHVLLFGLRRADEAQDMLQRTAAWRSDPAWTRQFASWRLALGGFTGGFSDRLAAVEVMLAEPDLEPDHRRQLELTHVLALMSVGRPREAHAIARRIRPAVPIRAPREGYALRSMYLVALESGEDWEDLEAYMTGTLRDGVRAGDQEASGLAAFTLASLALERGRYRDGERWLNEAEAQLERSDTFDTVFCIRALQVAIACFTGDVAAAQRALESARAVRPEHGLTLPGVAGYAACAEGWGARALSDAAGARRFQEEAARAEDPSLRSRLLYEALRAGGRPAALAAELTELATRCDSALTTARGAYGAARAARDGEALLAASRQFAQIGALASAKDAAIDAAREFVAAGRQDSARRAAATARDLHPTDQGPEFPFVDGLSGIASDLSPREAQIAALAARGLSNHEIADQLVLSVRTVETYVYRAMQKRDVSHRTEL
ncbi:MAG TPA: LuxR C-terminal-related transcriptional regulator [Solirubrobacteraceae bacterium]